MPWIGSRYNTFLASQIVIDALFAVSLNLLLGTTGLVSFGLSDINLRTGASGFALALVLLSLLLLTGYGGMVSI